MGVRRSAPPTMGPLERQAMEVLWAHDAQYLQVRDVAARMDPDLAYTTVMTVLVRLWQKGMVTRRPRGRAYEYRPSLTRSQYTARTMAQTMRGGGDIPDVLLRFVGELTPEQQKALRQLLED